MAYKFEVGDVVLCTVDRIVGTTVFVKIPVNSDEIEGSIVTSEIAPGRIRNLRDYVFPGKKIVCKVLRISGDRIDLSLRRVTLKEQKEAKEQFNQERSYKSILKSIVGEKAEDIIKEISKEESIYNFIQESRENPKKLEKLVGKDNAEKVLSIIKLQKQKKTIVKKEINLSTKAPDGLRIIKEILGKFNEKEIEIRYLAAGKYTLKTESSDPKTADNKLKEAISDIESQAKKENMDFSVKEK